MKIRSAKKILNIMKRGTDERYFDSEDGIKEDSRFLPRFGYLYKKAVVRWNKANAPSAKRLCVSCNFEKFKRVQSL